MKNTDSAKKNKSFQNLKKFGVFYRLLIHKDVYLYESIGEKCQVYIKVFV